MFATKQERMYTNAKIVIEPDIKDKFPIGKLYDKLFREGIWCELFAVYCPVLTSGATGMHRLEIFPTDSPRVARKIESILSTVPEEYIQFG